MINERLRLPHALSLFIGVTVGFISVNAQPRPRPTPEGLKPPLKLHSVSLNRGVPKLFHRLGDLPTPTPEFTFPRTPTPGTNFVLEFQTRDGRGTISFSHTLPSDVQANAFSWLQSSGLPPATGRLRYNLCGECPSSFLLEITVKDAMDFNHPPRTEQVRINLTASDGPPQITNIQRINQDRVRPQFRISFVRGTFKSEDSHIEGRYSGGLRIRLLPQIITDTTMTVVIERFKVNRAVRIFLSNPLGGSNAPVTLPGQALESNQFECINCSTCFSCAGAPAEMPLDDTFSVQRKGSGLGNISGTETIALHPAREESKCDEEDHVFTGARVAVLYPDGSVNPPVRGRGTATITQHPPTNALLRKPDNKIKVHWTKPGWIDDWWYQVAPSGVTVVGICSDRVIH